MRRAPGHRRQRRTGPSPTPQVRIAAPQLAHDVAAGAVPCKTELPFGCDPRTALRSMAAASGDRASFRGPAYYGSTPFIHSSHAGRWLFSDGNGAFEAAVPIVPTPFASSPPPNRATVLGAVDPARTVSAHRSKIHREERRRGRRRRAGVAHAIVRHCFADSRHAATVTTEMEVLSVAAKAARGHVVSAPGRVLVEPIAAHVEAPRDRRVLIEHEASPARWACSRLTTRVGADRPRIDRRTPYRHGDANGLETV